MNIGEYLKSIVPGLITIGYAVNAAVSDNKVTNTEWMALGSLILTTVAAWLVPNTKATQSTQTQASGVTQPTPVSGEQNVPFTIQATDPGASQAITPLIPPDTTS